MVEKNGNNKIITILLAIIITFAAIAILYVSLPQDEDESNKNTNYIPLESEEDVIFTVSYLKKAQTGLNTVVGPYTLYGLENLSSITGYGGYRTSFPAIKGQGTYTGIPVTTLVEQTGEQFTNYTVIVNSNEDGEKNSKTYSYDMVQGNLSIYNSTNASDETPISTGGVTMILCYQKDGEYLEESKDGKLKIAFVNEEEELITTAGLWWKYIVSIEIIE